MISPTNDLYRSIILAVRFPHLKMTFCCCGCLPATVFLTSVYICVRHSLGCCNWVLNPRTRERRASSPMKYTAAITFKFHATEILRRHKSSEVTSRERYYWRRSVLRGFSLAARCSRRSLHIWRPHPLPEVSRETHSQQEVRHLLLIIVSASPSPFLPSHRTPIRFDEEEKARKTWKFRTKPYSVVL